MDVGDTCRPQRLKLVDIEAGAMPMAERDIGDTAFWLLSGGRERGAESWAAAGAWKKWHARASG
jgi:hypothetical protein